LKTQIISLILLLIGCEQLYAQEPRIFDLSRTNTSVKIDGIIKDEAWGNCSVYSNFIQTVPNPDQPSAYKTEVRMCYDNAAIYISAELFQPKHLLSNQMTARDALGRCNADVFSVFLDTYNDQQNGFAFRVSSAGVQQDERLSGGNEYGDTGWDAVWSSSVSITDSSWIVEIEIPLSAIRFSNAQNQAWRVNFLRMVRKKNESSYCSRIDVNRQGFLAQTGIVNGINNIKPPVRLFLFPYLSTGYLEQPEGNSTTKQWLKSGGLDLKYGLNESFTLDMTLIPDFSQVISDNLVRNLSPFEQQLTENRPFFTEGTELFNKAGIFYTRRVGARPSRYSSVKYLYNDTSLYEIEKNPNVTRLYNAFKISGRNKHNLGIGIFNAVGAPSKATIKDKKNNSIITKETESLANYNVVVFDQPFKGQSFFNFTNTNVLRRGADADANVTALQFVKFNKKENYKLGLTTKTSIVNSNAYAIGNSFGIEFAKISGLFGFSVSAESQSPKFDQSDMGIQFDYNNSFQNITLNYNQNKPKNKHFQFYRLQTSHTLSENTIPLKFKAYRGAASYFILFKNFWDITFEFETKPIQPKDYYQLGAFNKVLNMLPYFYNSINGSSDSRKKLFWAYNFGYGLSNQKNADYLYLFQQLRYQFGSKLELNIKGEYTFDRSNIGYAYYDNSINEPIVGRRNVKESNGEFSLKYNFNPTMNLTGRFRHYNSTIHYKSLHTVNINGEWKNNIVVNNANLNENYNLQNVDIFFNWMFKPGSRIVLSYKQWLNDAYLLNNQQENHYFNNVYQVVKSPHAFEIAARVIYFLDYNKIKPNSLKNKTINN
jgi:hypothetical protein